MTQQYSEPERGLSVKFTYLLLLRVSVTENRNVSSNYIPVMVNKDFHIPLPPGPKSGTPILILR